MIKVYENLFVGNQNDEQLLRGSPGWFFVHACKEPYHRQALGYKGRSAPKGHPEYLIAQRNDRIILNLIDADNVRYIPHEIISTAILAINQNIQTKRVLLHCNQGHSRSPSIALLYLSLYTKLFSGMTIDDAIAAFKRRYPPYAPARGMAEYVRMNWTKYQFETSANPAFK